jgi:hypothetical protein
MRQWGSLQRVKFKLLSRVVGVRSLFFSTLQQIIRPIYDDQVPTSPLIRCNGSVDLLHVILSFVSPMYGRSYDDLSSMLGLAACRNRQAQTISRATMRLRTCRKAPPARDGLLLSGFSFASHNAPRCASSLYPSLLGLKFHPQLLMSTLFSYCLSL